MWDLTDYSIRELIDMNSMSEGELLDKFSFVIDIDFYLALKYELEGRGIDIDELDQIPKRERMSRKLNPSRRDS